jgi:hypothetical protein
VDRTGPTEEITMRTPLVIAGSLSAGALAVALAVPVVAAPANGAAAGTCTGDGPVASSTMARGGGDGTGMQYRGGAATGRQNAHGSADATATARHRSTEKARGTGQARAGARTRGTGRGRATPGTSTQQAPSGTLTTAQRTELAAMAEEEKMAHDVYVTLAARYPELTQFARIATSETQHLTALRTLMTRYGIADPTLGEAVGEFESSRMQDLYDTLVAGATTPQAALAAGVTIEKTDIADLTSTMIGVSAQDVLRVYTNLRAASQNHLAAFSR